MAKTYGCGHLYLWPVKGVLATDRLSQQLYLKNLPQLAGGIAMLAELECLCVTGSDGKSASERRENALVLAESGPVAKVGGETFREKQNKLVD